MELPCFEGSAELEGLHCGFGGKSKKQNWEQWLRNLHLMRKIHGGKGKTTFSDLKG